MVFTSENTIRTENDFNGLEQWPEVNSREFSDGRESTALCGSSAKKRGGNSTQS